MPYPPCREVIKEYSTTTIRLIVGVYAKERDSLSVSDCVTKYLNYISERNEYVAFEQIDRSRQWKIFFTDRNK